MSAKWMGYFFDDTDLKGSKLLLALAIADHADQDGRCYPGLSKLAKKIRLGVRQTKLLFKELEAEGWVESVRGKGRGHHSMLQLKKVQSSAPFTETETGEQIVQPGAPIEEIKGAAQCTLSEDKRCAPADTKGALPPTQKVRSDNTPPYEPLFKPDITPPENGRTRARQTVENVLAEDREVLVWMNAVAGLVGATSESTMADRERWRFVCRSLVREKWEITQLLAAVTIVRNGTRDNPRFFTPDAVMKQMQLTRATTISSANGVNPQTGRKFGEFTR